MSNDKFHSIRKRRHIFLCAPRISSLGVIRGFGSEGISPIIVSLRPKPQVPLQLCFWSSRYIKEVHYVDSLEEGLELIINRWGNEEEKSFLHVMSEAGVRLLDANYDRLKDAFYFFHGKGGAHALAPFYDKSAQCALAAECGFRTPASEVVARGALPQHLSYPIYIKCRDSFGAWKRDMAICHSPQELLDTYPKLESDQWLMQEFVDRKYEVSLQGLSLHDGDEIYMPYVKVYTRLRDTDYGTYMYYERNRLPDDLNRNIEKAIRKIGFNGCFEIEFLQDKEERLFFLEINLRYSASNPGMRHGGVNMPLEWALAESEGHLCTDSIILKEKRFYAMNEIIDIETQLLAGRISLTNWLKDVWRADSFYLFSAKDPMPFMKYSVLMGKRMLRKLRSYLHK